MSRHAAGGWSPAGSECSWRWCMAANTTWFPSSQFAGEWSWWRREVLGLAPVQLAAALLGVTVLLLLVRARKRLPTPRLAGGLAGGPAGLRRGVRRVAAADPPRRRELRGPGAERRDHRPRFTAQRPGSAAPRAGRRPAHPRIPRAIAPFQRRDHAAGPHLWVVGHHPQRPASGHHQRARQSHAAGARARGPNARRMRLRDRGYRSIYATDEVRFANFDESYGFDQLITPPVGGLDFVLGIAGDMPLVNLAAYSRAGAWLFPSNHGNRAADITYHPRQFLDRLGPRPGSRRTHVPGAAHDARALALRLGGHAEAHRASRVPRHVCRRHCRTGPAVRCGHAPARRQGPARQCDRGAAVRPWRSAGSAVRLDAEGVRKQPGDLGLAVGPRDQRAEPEPVSRAAGHAGVRPCAAAGPELDYDWPVSLEDIRPTLEEFATGRVPAGTDGISLLPYMAEPARARSLESRIRFTETDFNTPLTLAGRYEASGIIDEALVYYEVDRDTGWVQFRADRLPDLLAQKQRAAIHARPFPGRTAGVPASRYAVPVHGPRRAAAAAPGRASRPRPEQRGQTALGRPAQAFPGGTGQVPDPPRM